MGVKLKTMEKNKSTSNYKDALKHVNKLKEFYQQIFVFIVFLIFWLLFKQNIIEFVVNKTDNGNSGFLKWLNINITLVPVIWGIILLFQGLYLHKFKLSIFKNWEDKKIKEFMNQEIDNTNNTQLKD